MQQSRWWRNSLLLLHQISQGAPAPVAELARIGWTTGVAQLSPGEAVGAVRVGRGGNNFGEVRPDVGGVLVGAQLQTLNAGERAVAIDEGAEQPVPTGLAHLHSVVAIGVADGFIHHNHRVVRAPRLVGHVVKQTNSHAAERMPLIHSDSTDDRPAIHRAIVDEAAALARHLIQLRTTTDHEKEPHRELHVVSTSISWLGNPEQKIRAWSCPRVESASRSLLWARRFLLSWPRTAAGSVATCNSLPGEEIRAALPLARSSL